MSTWERGTSEIELMVVVAIMLATTVGGFATLVLDASQHGTTMLELVGVLDRVHAEASAGGAVLQVAPAASGSALAIAQSTTSLVTYQGTTLEPLGLAADGSLYTTFSLAVRRDGSFVPYAGSTALDCTNGVVLGIVSGGIMAESAPLGCDDLHLVVSPAP